MSLRKLFVNAVCWAPAILYMALIFHLSSGPVPEPVKHTPIFVQIKVSHITEYAILNLLLFFAIRTTTKVPYGWQAVYSIFLTYIYGLTDELHQVFVPGRSASFIDSFTNLISAVLVQGVIYLVMRRFKKPG